MGRCYNHMLLLIRVRAMIHTQILSFRVSALTMPTTSEKKRSLGGRNQIMISFLELITVLVIHYSKIYQPKE